MVSGQVLAFRRSAGGSSPAIWGDNGGLGLPCGCCVHGWPTTRDRRYVIDGKHHIVARVVYPPPGMCNTLSLELTVGIWRRLSGHTCPAVITNSGKI
ncbi:MAG: hypothetical protein E3K40_01460 [Candidatus Brocadia sp.]|nr:hypothetical protein [Candidatus Brocadia sp.]